MDKLSSAVCFASSAAWRIDKPMQEDTAITSTIIPIKTLRAFERDIHLSAFFYYIHMYSPFC